jgi:hypothetical protein
VNRLITIVVVISISQIIAHEARAEEDFDLRFGAKGTFTGLLWNRPDNAPPYSNRDAFWADNQFYYGGGGGLFVEGNAFKYLGLEIDLLFEFNSLTFNFTYNNFEYDYYTDFDQLRIPILIKGVLPLGKSVEMSLGIGPEFVVGLDADVETDRRTNFTPARNQWMDQWLANSYFADKESGTFFDLDLGIAIKTWKLIIPINLRAAFNLDQSPDFDERVTLLSRTGPGTVKAIESMHFAVLIGVGYLLPL